MMYSHLIYFPSRRRCCDNSVSDSSSLFPCLMMCSLLASGEAEDAQQLQLPLLFLGNSIVRERGRGKLGYLPEQYHHHCCPAAAINNIAIATASSVILS